MIKHTFLLELRKNQGVSQAFMAEKIGLSRASYIEIEKGAKELTLSQANQVADIFHITLPELISGEKISSIKVSINDVVVHQYAFLVSLFSPQHHL